MKAVIQRVSRASVSVNGELISSIGKGLCVLVGICKSDTDKDIEYILEGREQHKAVMAYGVNSGNVAKRRKCGHVSVRKLLNLRLWSDGEGKRWTHSLSSQKYEILCVSQFTLYHTLKGNSPDFHQAMPSPDSKDFFDKFISQLKAAHAPELVKEGKFGHFMQVDIQGDGPVTIQLESPKMENSNQSKRTAKNPAETGVEN